MNDNLPSVTLPSGESMPAFGQGTWHMGEDRRRAADEEAALKLGIELGINLIDTAEMYGQGAAEEIVARATAGLRDRLFIVSKVLPYNASQKGVVEACERSLKRLKTDRIDLYLLHWRGSVPLAETIAGFARLQRDGKIRHHGVSNFSTEDIREWVGLAGGETVASNQILYNLSRRGPEWELIPWCRERRISLMAYTPLEQGRMLGNRALNAVASRHGASAAQVALAWLLRQDGVIVIPKATQPAHVRDNRAALDLALDADDLAALDRAFPPPKGRTPLGDAVAPRGFSRRLPGSRVVVKVARQHAGGSPMADLTIYLGNKNYSSWSLRPWLVLKRTTVAFDEVVIPLYQPGSRQTVLKYSPSGRVPVLHHDGVTVWESLAICEYLAETFPNFELWPKDPAARARARSVSAEMQSSFRALREHLPMNVRSSFPGRGVTAEVQADINRIMAIWRDCRTRYGDGKGEFLFGQFTIADAMFAPVVTRFRTYRVDLEREADSYCDTIMAMPAMQEWIAAAKNEPMIVEAFEF